LLRSEVTLGARTATLAFEPADERLLNTIERSGRVYVARFESDAAVHIGTLALNADPARRHYALWLERTGAGWQLQVADADGGSRSQSARVFGRVSLSHEASEIVSPAFAAALIPIDHDAARLMMRWAAHQWTADVHFGPARSSIDRNDLEPDAALKAIARAQRLNERNETAQVFADGSRVSVLFWKGLGVDGRDFASLASTADGSVVRLTAGAITRFQTERAIRFGRVTLRPGNLAAGYPGVYGLWLKRSGSSWRLVFNNEADAWGTQHDPAFDAAEIDLAYSQQDSSSRPFAVALVPTAADRGSLVIHWGVHEWSTEFVVP
jgi:hypothetical protein